MGIAAKRLSGWGLVVWDHGMLWRERCKAIAELHSSSLFVRKSLISEYHNVGLRGVWGSIQDVWCTGVLALEPGGYSSQTPKWSDWARGLLAELLWSRSEVCTRAVCSGVHLLSRIPRNRPGRRTRRCRALGSGSTRNETLPT